MCYALPGARCSNHCFNDLSKARTAFLEAADRIKTDPHTREKFEAAKARFERAQARFDRSPEGQRLLREEAESIRATDPERAAALEALADKGARVHAKEVGASKKAALAEQRAFLDLQRKSNEAWEEARKVSERVSEQATPEERAHLAALYERQAVYLQQSYTTPLGLKMAREDLRLARQEYAAATTEEDRARAEKAVRFHAAHLAESKKKRARMLAEYHAKTKAREQADAYMREARKTGGVSALQHEKPKPKPEPVASEQDEASERRARFVAARRERREREDAARAEAERKTQASVAKNPSAVLAAAENRELKQWQHPKTGEVRFYPADQDEALGLDVSYYKSGNISSAAWQGESVSNSKAYSLKSAARELNPYIVDGEVRFTKSPRNSTEEEVAEKLRGYLEKKMAG